MVKKGLSLLLAILLILLVLPQPLILGLEVVTVEGTVREQSTGNPIPHAKILAVRRYKIGFGEERLGEADSNGRFALELTKGDWDYIIYAYYNDSLTPGFDYVPSMKQLLQEASGSYNLTFELWDGASMFLEGEFFFVETTETPQSSYSLLGPDSKGVIKYGEYTFNYGVFSPHYQIPGVSPNQIIVPADTSFMVKVESKIEVEGEKLIRSFLIDQPNHFLLQKGEAIHVDVGEYTLSSSLSVVREEASEIGLLIEERDEEGFYLAVERHRFAQINSLILEAENLLGQGAYEACFTRLRYAYTEISNLRDWLNSMGREALISVFLLILFLAFTATTTSHLLFEKKIKKIGGAPVFYALFLLALYLLYPGSRLVGVSWFLGASLLSLLAVLGLATWVPRVLKGREFRGRVPLRNLVVPVFSIAKRSLRRRRLRSLFTFITVMVLVSSFIALTSFTTGFGLTFSKVSSQPGPSTGITVRAPKLLTLPPPSPPPPSSSGVLKIGAEPCDVLWYPPLENSSIGWFEERPETLLVAPKYENLPRPQYNEDYRPLGDVGGEDIFGIIGIVPSAEAEVLPWNETIVEGRFLSDGDENGVLISKELKERINVTVGESLTFYHRVEGPLRLKIIGIIDDTRFEGLRDLDGESLLPWKIRKAGEIEMEQYGGPRPNIIKQALTPCSADEILVVTWKVASEIDGMYLSRLNVVCEEGEDMAEYAKMLTLNKGFRVWASTEEGVYLAQLSSYFQGKGLPLAVPWGIVVLNVVVTMLNSLYERRREIYVYSAIGMNPSHIAGAFLAEVAMIGVLGGGVGYLVGLGWYKAISLLALGLQVKQKVSALWVLGATAVSMAAVLTGGLAAIKGSVVITPSLKRRWRIEASAMGPLELSLPVRVTDAEVEGFIGYVEEKLRSRRDDLDYLTSWIRETREELEEASLRTIEFNYRRTDPITKIYSSNKVTLRKERDSQAHTAKLTTRGDPQGVHKAASLIRKIIMEWSIERGKLEEQ